MNGSQFTAGNDVRRFLRNCVEAKQIDTYAGPRRVGLWPAVAITAAVGVFAGWLGSVVQPW